MRRKHYIINSTLEGDANLKIFIKLSQEPFLLILPEFKLFYLTEY